MCSISPAVGWVHFLNNIDSADPPGESAAEFLKALTLAVGQFSPFALVTPYTLVLVDLSPMLLQAAFSTLLVIEERRMNIYTLIQDGCCESDILIRSTCT